VPAAPATRWRRRRRTTPAAAPARVRTGSFGRPAQAQAQPELHVVAHRDAPAVHAVVVAVDGAAGEYVAVARRRLAPGRLDPELLAPLHAADAQDPAQRAAFAQQLDVIRIGQEFHLRPALRVEEAAAAGEAGVAGMADDLDVVGHHHQAHAELAVAERIDLAAQGREAALQCLAPAGMQGEAGLRGRGIDRVGARRVG